MLTPETRESNMTVQILLSTYNGQRFLDDQLKSIISQTIKDRGLLIRDDGSTDQTCDILKCFQQKYSWIHFYHGSNIGVQKSYLDLIRESDRQADYTVFSDQDDIWLPTKIERALQCLKQLEEDSPKGIPLLYCSNTTPVDEELRVLHMEIQRVVKKTSFGNALIQNVCTGCTAVANRVLMDLLRDHLPGESEKLIMHDWWIYLTASCFGKVYYDREAYILYRQHGENTSKMKISRNELLLYRFRRLQKPGGAIYRQVEAFKKNFSDELKRQEYCKEYKLLKNLLQSERSFLGRLRVMWDRNYFRQKWSDDLIFRMIVLIGKL